MIQPLAKRPDGSALLRSYTNQLPSWEPIGNVPPSNVNEQDFIAYAPHARVDPTGLFFLQGLARTHFTQACSQTLPSDWVVGGKRALLRMQLPANYPHRKFYFHYVMADCEVFDFAGGIRFLYHSNVMAEFEFGEGLSVTTNQAMFPFAVRKFADASAPFWTLAEIPVGPDALVWRYRAGSGATTASYVVVSFPTRLTLVADEVFLQVMMRDFAGPPSDPDPIIAFGMACYSQTHPF